MAISLENRQFLPSPCTYSPRCRGSPWNWVSAQGSEETRMIMMGLPDGRKSFKIGLAILIQYRRVTETPIQPRCRGIYRAMLCIAQVKITLEKTWENFLQNRAVQSFRKRLWQYKMDVDILIKLSSYRPISLTSTVC